VLSCPSLAALRTHRVASSTLVGWLMCLSAHTLCFPMGDGGQDTMFEPSFAALRAQARAGAGHFIRSVSNGH